MLIFCVVFVPGLSVAQFCNGNLGDPIINVTFGTTPAPVPPTRTTFSYTGGCPFDTGQYSIQGFIFGCGEDRNAHSWHSLIGDHTQNVNGQYMLINASWALGVSHPPSIIHLDTATSLCGNTTYQYTAWMANVMRDFACGGHPQLPNIIFRVTSLSGDTLATASTGSLPIMSDRVWQQYGLSFTTPPDVSAVILTLFIDAKPGCGNAFIVDDITLNMCGPAVLATIDGKTDPANVCADYTDPFILNGSYATGFNDPAVQWQNSLDSGVTWTDIPGQNTLSYAIPRRKSGAILYRLAVAERPNISSVHCRVVSNPIYTEVHPVPPHNPPANILGCLNKTLHLPVTDPSALKVEWTGPNGYFSTDPKSVVPDIDYGDTGIYRLKQQFYFGCTSIDTFNLSVFPSTTVTTQTLYSICEGSSINLAAAGDGTFKWTPSEGLSNDAIPNPVAAPHDSTVYRIVVTNSFGCKDSADVTVNVFKNAAADAGPDRTIVAGDTVLLAASVKGTAITYTWDPPLYMDNPLLVSPRAFPPESIQYTLTAASSVGCGTSVAKAFITVYKDIFIPSAFTPNNDGNNDRFRIFAADGYTFQKFQVYNRWGKLVFSAKNADDGWDGAAHNEPQPADTYIYYLELKKSSGKKIVKKGSITLLR